jgi:hypothetical protein
MFVWFRRECFFGHNPLTLYALLGLIADMRRVGLRKQSTARTRWPGNISAYQLVVSRTDLPNFMVRRLVEQILKLRPRPLAYTTREILELQ